MDRNTETSGYSAPDQRKNEYYRNGSRALMRIINIQAVLIFSLTVGLTTYLNDLQSQDRFYAATTDGKIMRITGLLLPNMGRMALSDWAASAASQIMTFGFNDYESRFYQSQKDFTPAGFETFRRAMRQIKLIEDMASLQQIITSSAFRPSRLERGGADRR